MERGGEGRGDGVGMGGGGEGGWKQWYTVFV